jgi:carboxylate-amine ligase
MEQRSAIQDVLDRVPAPILAGVKPELMQCYLEINTGVCRTVEEAGEDLRRKVLAVQTVTDSLGLRLFWGATHPFSLWRDQQVVPTERYRKLIDLLQDTARQLITFGLHVHVGVESGEKAILICNRLLQYLPLLLALSCNSPFWDGRVTGLQSSRSKVMEGLPTAGLPNPMRNWSEYTWLIDHLVETGFINTIREIWWDVRPHNNFGTVEVRICDMPGSLEDVLTITALIQSVVERMSEEIDNGSFPRDPYLMVVRQNKWRACRYGRRARLVDSYTQESRSVPELAEELCEWAAPSAERLGCSTELQRVAALAAAPSWADRQLAVLSETGDPAEVIRRFTAESRLSAA